MKQLLSIITALFLMLAVIGCGSSAGTNADTDTAPKQETAAAPKTAPGKTPTSLRYSLQSRIRARI